ncbi:acyltransferase [Blastococcus sp. TF02-8]|uniref:acyltransferase family protein n=1 Tax=Blastococcus sp. TF02-8 TaxID=2250574 RepID=UPI000DEA4B27|nr:acyltransferase [Blastococcus sp. TF02-8]RBY97734.1 acyltransferase [Blastococcus sp. TF02-8]
MRYPALNGLRALAATAVVTTHAAFWTAAYSDDTLGYAFARLDVGVAVFFALSGFLLSQPLFRAAAEGRPAPRTAAFLWRRALRILPAYWLCVVFAMLFLPENREMGTGDWLRFLTLTQIYSRNWHGEGLVHAWSLCTEVSFYVLLPLVVAGLLRLCGGVWRPGRILLALGAASLLGFGWFAWVASDPFLLGSLTLWLPAYLSWFGAGMAIAVLSVADPRWAPVRRARELAASPGTCWAGAAVLFWAASGPYTGANDLSRALTAGEGITKHLLYTLIAALAVWPLVFGDQTAGWGRRLLASRPMDWLGERSYGIFLFHMPLLIIMWDLFTRPLLLVLPVTWAAAVLVAAVVYRVVERPLVLRFRDVVRERPGAVDSGTGAGGHAGGVPAGSGTAAPA